MKKTLFALFAFSCANAFGQVVAGSTFFDQIVSNWHMGWTLDAVGSAAVPTDLHNAAGGTLGVYEAGSVLKFQGVKERHSVDLSVGYSHLYYDFSDASAFSDVNKVSLSAFYHYQLDENWSVFGLALGTLGAESSANMLDGGRMLLGCGAGYKINENLRFGLGAAALSRVENDWIAIPVAYLDWKINDSLSLRAFNGAALIYDVFQDGSLLLNFSFQYLNADYRLSDNGAGVSRSYVDSYYQIAVGATYNFTKTFYTSASVGGNFSRTLKFRTGGSSAEEIDVDSAPVFYLHFGCKF